MEDLMKKKCEKYGIPFEVLTEDERAKLREEIEAEKQGMAVCDSIWMTQKSASVLSNRSTTSNQSKGIRHSGALIHEIRLTIKNK